MFKRLLASSAVAITLMAGAIPNRPAEAVVPCTPWGEVKPLQLSSRVDAAAHTEPSCGGGIPSRIMASQGKVNLKVFTVKTKNGRREQRWQAWSIQKDTAGHADKAWKLKDPRGNRGRSLRSDGTIVGK